MFIASTFLGGKATPITPDYTPDAVNWTNVTGGGVGAASGSTNTQTFTGINQVITLAVTYTGTPSGVYYSKNGGAYQYLASGDTFTVQLGDTVLFYCETGATTSGTVTIKNNSDSATTLDTFTYTLTVS